MGFKFNPLFGTGLDVSGAASAASGGTIGAPVVGGTPNSLLEVDASGNLGQLGPLTNGQVLIGSTGGAAVPHTLTGTTSQVVVTNGAGTITLSLPQNIAATSTPQFANIQLTTTGAGLARITGSGTFATTQVDLSGTDVTNILPVSHGGLGQNTTAVNGSVPIGNGSGYTTAVITGTSNQVVVTNGSGSITLSLPQSISSTSSPTFANISLAPSGALDTSSAGTLAIGTSNANVINIGNAGTTINLQGTTFYQNVTNLNVANKLINLNTNGSAGSASNAGIDVEENAVVTAYINTSADRNSWQIKAPNQAGVITLSPGGSGFTIDQGSHNPVTIGTANGLSLSTQALSLALSSTSTTGALSSADWNTFNGKQSALTLGNLTDAGTDGITVTGGTGAVVGSGTSISQHVADATHNGYLSSTDWNTFNNKGTGIVTSVAVATSNGFAGSSSGGATPSLTLSTTVTGILKGNGTAISAATAGSDYVVPVTGDIVPTTFSGLVNNTANQTITGFNFANSVSSFEALVNIQITATANTYTTFKVQGTRKAATWTTNDCQSDFSGDAITGAAFSISSSGQVQLTIGNITGFTSATVKFRAITLS